MIEVNVTTTNYVVSSSENTFPITVTADNSIFTVTNVESVFSVTNVTPEISFSTEGAGFDFATKHLGDWVSGNQYARNDVVRYQYSIYICAIPYNQVLTSTTPPPQDTTNWELFVFNEWPRSYLTVTNQLTVNGSIVSAQGTFTNLAVSNQFSINGLNYPVSRGAYGQVLFTNGTSTAAWANLGDLVFWSLSSDLQTNGFNIVTGSDPAVPNPQLTIGSGKTGSFNSYLRFQQGGITATLASNDLRLQTLSGSGRIRITGSTVFVEDNLDVNRDANIDGDLTVKGNVFGTTYLKLGQGIRFPDGSIMTTTNYVPGSTGTVNIPIASASTLGVIRVGNYLQIDPTTGILSVNANALPSNYNLPAASTTVRGGIRVGNGLVISEGDVLNVTSSTEFGNVSLTQDLLTNGYKLRYDAVTNSHVDINSNNIEVKTQNSTVLLNNSGITSTVGTATSITAAATSVNITSPTIVFDANNPIEIKAPITVVGDDVSNSRLHVSRIYNFAGVGAPFFPAGVQFPDQTIQITAYDDGRFDNGDVSIPFNYRSWQQLITYLMNIDFIDPSLVWTEPDLG